MSEPLPSSSPRVTLFMPLYNEEECLISHVFKIINTFSENGLTGEIILGSNGSTDHTSLIGPILEEAFPGRVRFFHIPRRGAVGAAFCRAAALAASPHLITMDADLPVGLDFIPRALALLSDHTLVIGSKQAGTQRRSVCRRVGSGLFIAAARMLLRLPYDDYSVGAKAYRLAALRPWLNRLSADTNYVLEITAFCHNASLPVAVLPVSCTDWRRSRFNLLREAFLRFSHLFRFRYFREKLYSE